MLRKHSGTALLILVTSVLAPAPLFANNAESIGTLVTTMGTVAVRSASGETRNVQRRGQLFAGDTVVVRTKGFASVRMSDNAHISLGSDTEFTFEKYSYDANPATRDSVVMNLVRGCFRTVVGSVGSAKRDTYRIDTAIASIGIDGAYHGAAIVGDRLYTGTWDGATVITNAGGSLSLGEYGDYDFSRTYPGTAPEGLSGQLPALDCAPPHSLDLEDVN